MSSPLRSIHVVAGVITDARGRILLNRREGNRDLVGLWEFPGGKREPGESSEQALARELREELGIEAEIGAWLMDVPQLYPDKRLRLEVRQVTAWKGTPRGREGQAIMWVDPAKLERYSMPPADLPVVARLRQPARYLALARVDGEGWLDELATRIGADGCQLRLPALPAESLATVLRALRARFAEPLQLLVDGDIALAAAHGIGVHLQAEQLASIQQRPLPAPLAVAASCHDLAGLQRAQALGCRFAVLGPVLGAEALPPALGWEGFAALREQVGLPLYAAGGVSADDCTQAWRRGAHGVAEAAFVTG